MSRLALHCVVENGQEFLVIVLPRGGIADFVKVNRLVEQYEQTLISNFGDEVGEQLQVIVPGIIVNDYAGSER